MNGEAAQEVPLDAPLSAVLSSSTARLLEQELELRTVTDLLMHLPRRYEIRGELTPMGDLVPGERVTILGEVVEVRGAVPSGPRRRRSEVIVRDGETDVSLVFFGRWKPPRQLHPGVRALFSGRVSEYRGRVQLVHPDYVPVEESPGGTLDARAWSKRPTPVYPATAKLKSEKLARIVTELLELLPPLPDPVPERLRAASGQLGFDEAVRGVHRPRCEQTLARAQESLRYTEAFVLQTALLGYRAAAASIPGVPRPPVSGGLLDRFDAALPFRLTGDQREVGEVLRAELAGSTPMHRLVQGEVGSGKTVVALRAMLQAADTGGQAAMIAPTEVLARQHERSLRRALGPELSELLRPVLLTGGMGQAARRRALLDIASGRSRIVIGTHALLGERVGFCDLALVVVDEQHRFGVAQREALRSKGSAPPHLLVLSATPIPRTVAMTLFGDLDVSVIRELPAGRAGIVSHTVPWNRQSWLERVWSRLGEELRAGRQAFVVCPAIGDREGGGGAGDSAAPEETDGPPSLPGPFGPAPVALERVYETVAARPELRGRRIAMLHGRMPVAERERIMLDFAEGRTEVLVATTVIEVGVDVPNASVMVVAEAERFGVSQLHQLRGRVGRGEHPGLCLLLTGSVPGSPSRQRVDAVAGTLDGFVLAELDLKARREGDVLGTAQSGMRSSLRMLRVLRDLELIRRARRDAAALLMEDPELAGHPALEAALDRLRGEHRRALGSG
ncbi:MAG: ATP-dependent DNA helicase RecG [Pseudoclavibacter sp.]|nr:ATP-dependent DNA helicase RecG [Pseudoclavibacter sp.]